MIPCLCSIILLLFDSSVLQENLEGHLKRCPLLKQVQSLSAQPFYQKGINAGKEEDILLSVEDNVTSEMKRNAVYGMKVDKFRNLIKKIESIHGSACNDIRESFKIPEACDVWIKREVDGYVYLIVDCGSSFSFWWFFFFFFFIL